MKSSIQLHCLCGHQQSKALDVTEYELVVVTPGQTFFDFVYCGGCKMPIAFELPPGIVKRERDRYSGVVVIAKPLLLAS